MRNLLKENLLTVWYDHTHMKWYIPNDTYRSSHSLSHAMSTWCWISLILLQLLWWDIWRPLLPHACVISSKLTGIQTYNLDTLPNRELPKGQTPSLSIHQYSVHTVVTYLILQHLHTQRYGQLIDEVVVIYKHIVWFTYSLSYLHTLQYQLRILDCLVSLSVHARLYRLSIDQ